MKRQLPTLILALTLMGSIMHASPALAWKTIDTGIDDTTPVLPPTSVLPVITYPTDPLPLEPVVPIKKKPIPVDPTTPPVVIVDPGTGGGNTPIVVTPTTPVVSVPLVTTTGTCDASKEGYTKVDKQNLFYCDGLLWQLVALDETAKTCTSAQLGKYSLTAKNLEFCNGTKWLITGNKVVEACSQSLYGKLKFAKGAGSSKVVQFCDGDNWLDTTQKEAVFVAGPPGNCAGSQAYAPVCGMDGNVYYNPSYATCGGTIVSHSAAPKEVTQGWCLPLVYNCTTQVVTYCGSDGKEYNADGCGSLTLPAGVTATKGACAF